MLKGIALVLLIVVSIFTSFSFSAVQVKAQNMNLNESINVFHIYNETLFELNITYNNSTDILNLGNLMSNINNYTIIISNFNQTERTLRWFFSQYNPLNSFDFLVDKGFVIRIESNNIQSINLNNVEEKLNMLFKTKFLLYTKNTNEAILISGGNYNSYIKETLNLISYKYKGLYNLTIENSPSMLVYEYTNNGIRKIQTFFFSSNTVSPDIYSSNFFNIDYSRYLENLTRSSYASVSKLNFYLFGLVALNSTLNLKWQIGYDTNWIASSNYTLNNNNKIGKVIIRVSKLDPFIIVYQRVEPAVLNSTSKLIVSVFNIGRLKVPQVTVKLNLPNWLTANNNTLIFKNVTSAHQEKYVNITISGNINSGIYQIDAPIAYYSYNSTSLKTIGNTVQIGYKVKKFPSISFYISPYSSEWPDLLSSLTDLNVFIINTGNINASDVEIDLDYYKSIVGDLGVGKNITYPISLQPSSFNQLPSGGSAFNSISVTYYNGTQGYTVKIPSPPLATIGSSFSYLNYFEANADINSKEVNATSIFVRWIGEAFGFARSATITIYNSNLTSQGIIFTTHGSFNMYGNLIQATYSNARGYSTYIALSINLTRRDTFVIPAFMTVAPVSKNILIDPIVFTNALVISKSTNSSIIKLNSPVEVTLKLTNYGSAPLYNITVEDLISKGWNVTSGYTKASKDTLLPNETFIVSYIAIPKAPESANLGSTNTSFNIFGLSMNTFISSFQLKIAKSVVFNVYKWNALNLNGGYIEIYGSNNTLIAQLPIKNGNAIWDGYIDNFTLVVNYENVTVFVQPLNITYQTNTIDLRTYVFDFKIQIYDTFGFPVNNAQVILTGNITEIAQLTNGFNFYSIPKGVYLMNIKIGSYQYSIPIVIDNSTPTEINIYLPVIVLGGFAIKVTYLAGILLIIFACLFFYLYLRREKFKP